MDEESEAYKLLEMKLAIAQAHEKIDTHDLRITALGTTLGKVTQLLAQIRWMAVGALAFFVLNKVGLIAVIEKIIGI